MIPPYLYQWERKLHRPRWSPHTNKN